MNVTEILQSAKALTPTEPMELVHMILGSVSANDSEADTAWAQEAERRVQRIDSGEMAVTSVQEALAKYKHKPV
jgi:putative addiction module component (TIGR02574 family)